MVKSGRWGVRKAPKGGVVLAIGHLGQAKASCMEPAYPEREVAFRVAWYPVTERGRIRTGADRAGMHVHNKRTLETQSNIHRTKPHIALKS